MPACWLPVPTSGAALQICLVRAWDACSGCWIRSSRAGVWGIAGPNEIRRYHSIRSMPSKVTSLPSASVTIPAASSLSTM